MVKKLLLVILLVILILLSVILIRTVSFHSKQLQVDPVGAISINTEQIADRLSKAIQFKTISYQDSNQLDKNEFTGLLNYIENTYPNIHANLSREIVSDYSLLYKWTGEDEGLKPILLMSHLDVVPAESGSENIWSYPPFSGALAKGFIWGRGTLDDKGGVFGILEAVEYLIDLGFKPKRTIYLAFGHDEEVGGMNGALEIASFLKARKVELEYVLDEGGFIAGGILPGVYSPVALVGIAEKGYLSVELSVEDEPGHSSMPPDQTAIGILSAAINKLEQNQLPTNFTGPARTMFEYVGPELPFMKKMIFANLWLFGKLVEGQLQQSPTTNALIRTTTAATMFEAGEKENILPREAKAVLNFRVLPGESTQDTMSHIRKTIDDPRIVLTPSEHRTEPSFVSDIDSESFNIIQTTIHQVFTDVIVAPWLLVASTDSKHYLDISDNVYRFRPYRIGPEDMSRFHGIDERISITDYEDTVRFFVQILKNSNN